MASDLVSVEREADEAAAPQLRCRIMSIAERLFREIGYRKTTVADIGAELGMSPGNVYRFFPSKKALNEAVAERLLGDLDRELARIVDADASATERLRTFVATFHTMSAGQFVANRRMHDMVEAAMAESWDVIHRHIEVVNALLCRLVTDGIARGDFAEQDPTVAALCIHSAIIRFCHPVLIAQCGDEPGPTVDQMSDFVLAALGNRRPV